MKITNDFLQNASAGLTRGDTWITKNRITQHLELRKKDWYPIRILKSWTKSIVSCCGTAYYGSSIYSDIHVDSIVDKLHYANWAGVDLGKAKIFLDLFAKATKRDLDANTFSESVHAVSAITHTIERRIIGDTFVQNWLKKKNGLEILMSLSTREVDVTLGEQVFSVVRAIDAPEIYVRIGGSSVACLTVYRNNEMTADISEFACRVLDADKLETILLAASNHC